MKIKRQFWKKIKLTGYIYLSGYKYPDDEGHLNLRSCLNYAVINSAPRIGKYISTLELYNTFPHKIVKDTNMIEIGHSLCVRNIMNTTPVLKI